MNWISEHLQLILAVAGAVAYWLNQRREAEAARDAEKNPPPASLAEADADDEPVRAEPPLVEEKKFPLPPLARPLAPTDTFGGPSRPLVRRPETERRVEPAPAPVPVPTAIALETYAASLERQEQLATKMRELAEQRALVARKAAAVAVTDAAVAQSARAGHELRHDLRDPRSLRRAMVLREILGAPVALR
ncbi:MAG: hypothetical protein EBU32_11545 [Opitutaceae bacterium]|nr:hypothetical protein [Opitutaceae bacterium]